MDNNNNLGNYNLAQLMVTAAAREIADGEVVFVGMRLPLLGFLLAQNTHAPGAIGVYELGIVRDTPAPAPLMTMGDLPNLCRAQWLADTADAMGLLQQGGVDVSFIGGAQVDRFGNLNTSYIGGVETVETRLPGSGGACDLACLAQRHIIVMSHEKRRFVPRVDYITSPGALHCEDLVVESVFLSRHDPELPFEACGRLNFLTATIGGSFFMTNALLCPGPDYSGLLARGGPVAINMQQMRVSNAVVFFNVGAMEADPAARHTDSLRPVEGWFTLAGAQMNTLILHVGTGWPLPGYLDIDGMSYERIRHVDGGDLVTSCKTWLRYQFNISQPDATNFRPQPYEQLTRVLRDSGLSREADAIAVEKIRMRLEARVDAPWLRVFPHLLMVISHHGYSTSRAVFSFFLFVILGAAMYTVAVSNFGQPFFPFEQPPEPTTYVLPIGLGTVDAPLGCPGLDTIQYALDFAIPVINLGQDTFCRFVPVGSARWLWLTLHSLYGVLGAALGAVVVLTLTGVLRRD